MLTQTFRFKQNLNIGMAEFTFEGRETLEKEAKPIGGGAHVLVPKDWIGETVAVVRLEQEQDEDKTTNEG